MILPDLNKHVGSIKRLTYILSGYFNGGNHLALADVDKSTKLCSRLKYQGCFANDIIRGGSSPIRRVEGVSVKGCRRMRKLGIHSSFWHLDKLGY